jgi:hypothetical protein
MIISSRMERGTHTRQEPRETETAMQIADAITRSREYDEIVVVTVTDIAAAIRQAEGIAADAEEATDWAEEDLRENGSKVVGMWGWQQTTEDQQSWRIEIVSGTKGGAA